MKVYLYYSGRAKDLHANAMAADYIKRTSHYAPAEMIEVRGKTDLWAKHPTAKKILFDPAGRSMDSNTFAQLFSKAEMLGHDLVFVIGGHDGLPDAWKERADLLLSLSAMTMPHELARAVAAEQIYRAFTILRGHPYPR
ncbi:MAG TPA: 23S rRNA (pseudouridine(1915)-N(3))-methyltransferase RlmH [Bryobacteraceae bacterium]|nr:23S rRNA (pseudouridine(1915)-N(3))-methyltransferase RlmH [Bryobacteraceae bacterium]